MLIADGLDDAILGVIHVKGRPPVVVYDVPKVLHILRQQHPDPLSEEAHLQAVEHFEFNIADAYMGPDTPGYLYPKTLEEIRCGDLP